MKIIGLVIVFIALTAIVAPAEIKTQEVQYSGGGANMKGLLAYDDAVKGKRPGVLVVHEWWGENDYARGRAKMLAGMGYTALALDMYGDGKIAAHPDDAGKFADEVSKNEDVARARFQAAMDLLKKNPTVDPAHIAAIGYCFGGGVVLTMARMGLDLNGVASFHGMLMTKTPAQPGKVKASVLVCHGNADQFVSAADLDAFKKEMDAAKVDYKVVTYDGAKHSFTNPEADKLGKEFNMPIAYNADADKKSWAELDQFLKKVFAGKKVAQLLSGMEGAPAAP